MSENPNPFVRVGRPQIVTRTVRGRLVRPEDVPAAAAGEENRYGFARPSARSDSLGSRSGCRLR